jgi:hypothetical protein
MPTVQNCTNEKTLYVHRTAFFDRALECLRGKGGRGLLAAQKADELIDGVLCRNREATRWQFRFTRWGECRIKHCMKYDLGCGYRLVFIRQGTSIALLYIGSHDDCYRWISRNTGLVYEFDNTSQEMRTDGDALRKGASSSDGACSDSPVEDEYELNLMNRLNDKALREIFSGLINGRAIEQQP